MNVGDRGLKLLTGRLGAVWTKKIGFGRVSFHPLFMLLVLMAVGYGLWREVLVLFLLIALHELGHAAMADGLGYRVEELSLLPFGGVAKLAYGNIGFVPRHEAAIAVAGPAVNFLLIVLGAFMHAVGAWPSAFYHLTLELNLWIAVFNLLPALPLDGGRVWRAARARIVGYEQATKEGYTLAIAISLVLIILGLVSLWAGYPHLGVLILGVFLFLSAWIGRRDTSMETVRFLDAKRRANVSSTRVIRALAAPERTTVRDVVRQFAPDRYHLVYVMGSDGSVRTILEEDDLLEAVFAGHWMDPLQMWIARE